MDVHRARFVPYPTSAINCLAFSRPNDSGHHTVPALKLAVGRTSGSIEIWSPNQGNWYQEATFQDDGRSIDGLAWTQDPDEIDGDGRVILGQQRLFSIASSPTVTEWDLATGLVKRRSTGNFSEVWCFAVQPRMAAPKNLQEEEKDSQEIVAGCGDGTMVILSTAEDDLQFKRFLARVSGKKARCMCITYQTRDIVVAGFADSMIRVYDTRNGQQIRTMSFGVGLPGAPKTALVWQVKCLPNGDIVSGDSNGEVRIWDRRTYSLAQRIRGHGADCLDLVVSSDGNTIFSGSIDGKIAVYRRSQAGGARRHWAKISGRSIHHGEVKAMAAFDSKAFSVVILGGSGVAPMVFPLRDYGKAYPRSLSNLPHRSPIVSAPKARLLVSWWNEEISVWRIRKHSTTSDPSHPQQPKKLVATMALSGKQAIQSVAVTADGSLLAVATNQEIKLFDLQRKADTEGIAIQKVHLPSDIGALGARLLQFSPNGKWLAAIKADSEIHVARVLAARNNTGTVRIAPKIVELDRSTRKSTHQSGFKAYDRSITQLSFSSDSRVLAVCDRSGYIDTWILDGQEDLSLPVAEKLKIQDPDTSSNDDSDTSSSDDDDDDENIAFYGQHWIDNPASQLLPRLDSSPLIFSFRPSLQNSASIPQRDDRSHDLFVMTAKHDIHEFDVVVGGLTRWSRANSANTLPPEVACVKDRAMGAVWDVTGTRQRVWIYGTSWIFMLNLSADHTSTTKHAGGHRKRDLFSDGETLQGNPATKKIRMNTGAGGQMRARERDGFGSVGKRLENGQSTEIELDGQDEADDQALDDDVDMIDDAVPVVDVANDGSAGDETIQWDDAEQSIARHGEKPWWYSFEYRPILGMVALSTPDEDDDGNDDGALEVVIVERPVWEPTG